MGGIAWTREEDLLLVNCIKQYGEGKWHRVPQLSGLKRCRKSCRLRWLNYLRPNIKRGKFSEDEVDLILKLHKLLGNKWSLIAGRLPGRTANDVKNYWNHHLRKKLSPNNNDQIESSPKPISSSPHDHQVEVIAPQASSSLQHLLGFEPFLCGEGPQQPMVTHQDHDRHEADVEDDDHDSCFEECGKIYRQLFHDLHEFEDLDRDLDLDRVVEDRGIGRKWE